VAFDDHAMDSGTRSHPRAAEAPPSTAQPAAPVPLDGALALTARQVSQLQRSLGNRATTILVGRARPSGDTVQVQRAKPGQGASKGRPVLPGRSKRLRAAEQEDLAAMDRANLAAGPGRGEGPADPRHNPFDALSVEEEEPAPTVPEKPFIDKLRDANGDVQTLRALLEPVYGDKAGAMSRMLRSRTFTTIEALEKAVNYKAAEQATRDEAPAATSGRSLNVHTGRPVPNLPRAAVGGFRAGIPAAWHVHFDHVKFGNSTASRVNFTSRTPATITTEVTAALRRITDRTGYDACRQWMNTNLGTHL
jgi:hypothetical protein